MINEDLSSPKLFDEKGCAIIWVMVRGSGLSERKMKNKKFRKIEKAIFVAYFKLKNYPNARRIARMARISRSTLYRHQTMIYRIPHDYEDYLIEQYDRTMKGCLLKSCVSLKTMVHCMLVFILMNRRVFGELLKMGDDNVVRRLIRRCKQKVLDEWGRDDGLVKIFGIYENEVLGLIIDWGREGFSDEKMSDVLNGIMYLTRTARQRLGPIAR